MPVSLSQLTAQTATREIGGKEYVFSPLTLADLAAVQAWYCDLPLSDCESLLMAHALLYDDSEISEMKRDAKAEHKKRIRVMNKLEDDEEIRSNVQHDMLREFSSLRGIAQFAFRSLRHAHPEITEAQASDMLDVESMSAISELLDLLSMPQAERGDTIIEQVAEETAEKKTD